jgi:hypothetical protein
MDPWLAWLVLCFVNLAGVQFSSDYIRTAKKYLEPFDQLYAQYHRVCVHDMIVDIMADIKVDPSFTP